MRLPNTRSLTLLSAVVFMGSCVRAAFAQNEQVVQWINPSGQDAVTVLNSATPFVTDFKGVDDVTVTQLSGTTDPLYTDNYGATNSGGPGNNPAYITNFMGTTATGTGNGAAGVWTLLQTTDGVSWRFSFSIPLDPTDKFLVTDVDNNEQYEIQAFSSTGAAESLTGWTEQNFSGQMGIAPNSDWPTWNATDGTLTSSDDTNLNEPLVVLTPDEDVSSIVFTQVTGDEGTAAIQFVGSPVPEPSAFAIAMIALFALAAWRRRALHARSGPRNAPIAHRSRGRASETQTISWLLRA